MKALMKIACLVFIVLLLFNCSNEDDQAIEENVSLSKLQLQGLWKITYFENQVDKTSDYFGYYLMFNIEDEIRVNAEETEVNGQYTLFSDLIENQTYSIIDTRFSEIDMYTDINEKLNELTEQWIVKRVTNNDTKIELEERISDNPPEILHLEKIPD